MDSRDRGAAPPALAWLAMPGRALELARLHANGELAALLPEVEALYGVPQNEVHHPEVCTGVHTEMALAMAERLCASPAASFAVLVHDLGKALTPAEELPRHVDHEIRGLKPVATVCDRLKVPAYWRQLALLVCEMHLHVHRGLEHRSKTALKLLHATGLEADETLFNDFLTACEADKRGRLNMTERPYRVKPFWLAARAALRDLPAAGSAPIQDRATSDRHAQRIQAVRQATAPFRHPN